MSWQIEKEIAERMEKERKTVQRAITRLSYQDYSLKDVEYTKLTLIVKPSEIFMVTSGVDAEGAPIVAFDSADDLWRALLKWSRKTEQGQHNWRGDKGFKPRE